jgi:predicted membrane-bound dolichyl-phosphate-mannose-protein mannosyltransferase
LLAALWAASLVPLISVGAANARLVEAFATDEALQLNLLRAANAKHTFALTFGPYGHLVFNLVLSVLRVLPHEVTDARIVHTARGVSLVFAAAALWLTFVWARRVFGDAAAWVAFTLLCVNATLYEWAVVLKPDMAQLFFLMLALALTCRLADEPRLRWLVLASSAAGLAFACKYSGLFVLPVIGAVAAWRPIEQRHADAKVTALRWLTAGKALLMLVGSRFLDMTWIAANLTEDGHIDAAVSPHTLSVLSVIVRGTALVLGFAAATPWVWSTLRRRSRLVATLWSWVVAAMVFAASFIVASPYSLRKAAFVKGLFVEASDAAAPLTAEWVSTWLRGIATAVTWPVLIAALITMAGLVWLAATRRARLGASQAIVMAWTAIYVLVLSAPVHEFYVHYALPLAPPAAMFAGGGLVAAGTWLANSFRQRRLAGAFVTTATIIMAVPLSVSVFATREVLMNRERTSAAIFVGRWLECRVPVSSRVAYDYFSYVPPAFRDVSPTWGGTRAWLSTFDPDIVIVNRVTAQPVMTEDRHREYYQCLSDRTCGYAPVLSRETLTVYARSDQAAALSTREAPVPRACAGLE